MTRRIGALLVVVVFGVAACGGDDGDDDASSESTSEPTADTAGTEPTDAPDLDPTTSSRTDVSQPDGGEPEGGSCTVNVEGDATASWTSPGGPSALSIDYWSIDDNPVTDGAFSWTVNCPGPGMSALSLVAAKGVNEAEIPFGPKSLVVRANVDDAKGELQQLFSLEGNEDVVWELETPGTVEITMFDDEHIAGTFELEYHNGLASLVDQPDQHITVRGDFDYDNPNVG